MSHRIFLAGAAGVIGRRLTPLLRSAGHTVIGTTRTAQGADTLRALGAEAAVVDVFDADALTCAAVAARPDIVMHQLTDLAMLHDPATRDEAVARNARIRREGTRNLVQAAHAAGARRLVAQSIAWIYAPGALPHTEQDPLDTSGSGPTAGAVAALEQQVLDAAPIEGVVLRYGLFYGPGSNDAPVHPVAVHVDAAAHAALLALDHGHGIYNIADANDQVTSDKARAELGWRADFRLPS